MAVSAAAAAVWVTCSTKIVHNYELKSHLFANEGIGLAASGIKKNYKTCSLPITCRFTPNRYPVSVPLRVAYELLQAGHRYLDVRTPEEFSQGHVPGAVNIPYMLRVASGMATNTHFTAQVSSHFGKDDEILVGCQSGKRSIMAANDLVSAGYSGIVDVAGGYGAWVESQLPVQV